MRSWARCAVAAWLLCACENVATVGPCVNESSCPAMHACIDGECVPKESDAGGPTPRMDAGSSCTPTERAIAARGPLDVVLVVDDVHALGELGASIQSAVTTTLVPALDAAEVDYRIVLVSACEYELTDVPAERYTRFPLIVRAQNDFETLIANYVMRVRPSGFGFEDLVRLNRCVPIGMIEGMPGWQSVLRPGAMKVFVHFVDPMGRQDGIADGGGSFDEALLELDPEMFGTEADMRFVYHVFAGLRDPTGKPALFCPAEPLVMQRCQMRGSSRTLVYQESAQNSGGYRASLCDTERFAEEMTAVVARTVGASNACRIAVDDPSVDLETLALEWTTATTRDVARVSDASGCTGESFYLEGSTIVLCPATCDLVRGGVCTATGAEAGTLGARWGCSE